MQYQSVALRWDLQLHEYGKQIKLSELYENIPISSKIRIPLYEPQKKAVAAMYRLEQCGQLSLVRNHHLHSAVRYLYKTHSGILSNPLGSGKTLTILSLIATIPIPPARSFKVQPTLSNDFSSTRNHWIPPVNKNNICIKKRINKIIRPALIFSGRPALKQWLYAVESQTALRVFLIDNVRLLRDFGNMLKTGEVNQYDVIIVKNGTVGGYVAMGEIKESYKLEHINKTSTKELYNMISNMTRDKCFSRLIIDDFDQIGLPKMIGEINALFTWYVSSTAKYSQKNKWGTDHIYDHQKLLMQNNPHDNISIESLLYGSYATREIIYNSKILFSNFNICCTDKLITDTIQIGKPNFYVYRIKNVDDVLIAALGAIGDKKVTTIFEMLNGDAIDEAANKAGIATANTKDIFQKILADSYNLWNKSRQVLRFIDIESKPAAWHKRLTMDLNIKGEHYGKTELRIIKPIKYHFPNLMNLFHDEYGHWAIIKTEKGKSIERVQNNLQANACAICNMSLTKHSIDDIEEDDDDLDEFMAEMLGNDTELSIEPESESKSVIMMKCCGIILCADCGMSGSNFRRTYRYKGKRYAKELIAGLCANCKCDIVFDDLIFINKDFDHDKIIMERIEDEDDEEKENAPIPPPPPKKPKKKTRTKIDVLLDIIKGKKPEGQKKLDKHIPNIMVGMAELPMPSPKEIKVLVFSNYEETLANVKIRLKAEKIKYGKLHGTANNIHNTAVRFNTSTDLNILLINSVKYCASLNLQMATDCVFMHKILNKSIESQVSGRAQRLGRKHNLRIHYLAYDNEMQYI